MPLEKELQYRQLQDTKLKNIAKGLTHDEHEKFELFDSLFYRKSTKTPRFVVPESMVHNVVRYYHDDMAHCGYKKNSGH